jgi:hypothetical protein
VKPRGRRCRGWHNRSGAAPGVGVQTSPGPTIHAPEEMWPRGDTRERSAQRARSSLISFSTSTSSPSW